MIINTSLFELSEGNYSSLGEIYEEFETWEYGESDLAYCFNRNDVRPYFISEMIEHDPRLKLIKEDVLWERILKQINKDINNYLGFRTTEMVKYSYFEYEGRSIFFKYKDLLIDFAEDKVYKVEKFKKTYIGKPNIVLNALGISENELSDITINYNKSFIEENIAYKSQWRTYTKKEMYDEVIRQLICQLGLSGYDFEQYIDITFSEMAEEEESIKENLFKTITYDSFEVGDMIDPKLQIN